MSRFPVLSFFSGGGFLDMGFEMAGFNIIWSNEFDQTIAQFHSDGITSWRKSRGNGVRAEIFNTKSIDEISNNEIIKEAFGGNPSGNFGVIGGPPCQDFSLNGKHKGFEGTRGRLTKVFFDKILCLLPTFFVMENVPGLIRNKAHYKHLQNLMKDINSKYFTDQKILNALNFGVPQSRERFFIIGIKKSKLVENKLEVKIDGSWFPWPKELIEEPLKTYKWPSTDFLGNPPIRNPEIPYELCVEQCLVKESEIDYVPNGKEYFQLHISNEKLKEIKEGETNRPSFKRLHRYRYSPTACYGNNEVHLHPFENRRLSVREALRIQGVPDDYVLPSGISLSKKFKMIGNGVPVPLAEVVAKSLKNFLEGQGII